MVKFSKAGISRVQRIQRYLSYLGMGGVLWLSSGPLWAANSAGATFKAEITQGTCDVIVDSNNIELGIVQFADLVLGKVNRETQITLRNCTSVVNRNSITPTITVTGNHVGTNDKSLFRDKGADEKNEASMAVGITVQLKKFSGTEWSPDLKDDEPFHLANKGTIVNDKTPTVPVKFSLVCALAGGQTVAVCKKAGKIKATLTFTFNYR
ncbi:MULTISPECIES: fimbrial protein [unclassified Photorhabdus]|uniref:fimbrial protein n=1 Tax=unclassified Photorhabdus TaxID=2620880 RepID=UPI001EFDD6E3|nr:MULTISPECIES: fimbrial protein [unclassified Photorhabdus]